MGLPTAWEALGKKEAEEEPRERKHLQAHSVFIYPQGKCSVDSAMCQQDKFGSKIPITRKEKASSLAKIELGPMKAVYLGSLREMWGPILIVAFYEVSHNHWK